MNDKKEKHMNGEMGKKEAETRKEWGSEKQTEGLNKGAKGEKEEDKKKKMAECGCKYF